MQIPMTAKFIVEIDDSQPPEWLHDGKNYMEPYSQGKGLEWLIGDVLEQLAANKCSTNISNYIVGFDDIVKQMAHNLRSAEVSDC